MGMKLKDLIFTEGNSVSLSHLDDGDAVYDLIQATDGHVLNVRLLTFTVPREDLRGATFKLHDSPKFFMRWIRKELEHQEEAARILEQARKDWAERNDTDG